MRYAQSLPEGTFGHAYGAFMAQRSFRADDRPPVRFVDDEELAYVAQRAREVHDLWHVLFNCKTSVLGELALKAVEFVQVCKQSALLERCDDTKPHIFLDDTTPGKMQSPTGHSPFW